MFRAMLAATCLTTTPFAAQAHDFWIAPDTYRAAPGASVDLGFVIGHGADNEPWDMRWQRVVSMRSYLDGRTRDQQRGLRPQTTGRQPAQPGQASVLLEGAGTHIIAFESNHAFSELDPLAFENYLAEEGLDHVISLRAARGERAAPGTELYARRAKTLVQAGERLTDVSQPVGQTLEIVPLIHPFDPARGADMRFQVLYRGAPLQGGLVRLRSLDVVSAAPLRSVRTDQNGEVRMPVPKAGAWLVTVVWSSRLDAHPQAQFETMFSSLTFGYRD